MTTNGAGQKHAAESLRVTVAAPPTARRADWTARGRPPGKQPRLVAFGKAGAFGSDNWLEELKKDLGWREPKKRGRPAGPRRRKK